MKIVKDIFLSILISCVFTVVQNYLETTFFIEFLKNNLITLLVALLAINATTQSLILTKIRELIDTLPPEKRSGSFKNTRTQVENSNLEFIALIIIAIVLFTLVDSSKIQKSDAGLFLIHTGIISCFTYSLFNLYDNVKSVFVILDFNSGNE